MRIFQAFGNFRCAGQLSERGRQALPIAPAKPKSKKERRLAAVVGVRRVQQAKGSVPES